MQDYAGIIISIWLLAALATFLHVMRVSFLIRKIRLLEQEAEKRKNDLEAASNQLLLWEARASTEAGKAQRWLRRFQTMVETVTRVFMDEEDISPEGKRTVVVRPTEFSSARLIIIENSLGRDEVVIELRKPCGENIRSFNVHFIPCTRLGVDAIDEDYWTRGGSEGDFFEVLCANRLNMPPVASKGEEVKKWQPGFRAE